MDRVIRRRRMVRRYAERPLEPALIDELLDLALRAPSAGFTQAVSLQVLTGGDVARFWRITSAGDSRWLEGMQTAPALILVWCNQAAYYARYSEPDKGWDPDDQPWTAPYWYVDAGMAAQNILLGAAGRGLGACFFGIPQDRVEDVRRAFGVPDQELSVGVISLGWPDPGERPSGSPRHRPRRPRTELVHRGNW